jgi:hypothetical protein
MPQHAAFLLGRALAEVRRTDPATADRILADVATADLPAVTRGLEDVSCRGAGERAGDMALLIAGVRS